MTQRKMNEIEAGNLRYLQERHKWEAAAIYIRALIDRGVSFART